MAHPFLSMLIITGLRELSTNNNKKVFFFQIEKTPLTEYITLTAFPHICPNPVTKIKTALHIISLQRSPATSSLKSELTTECINCEHHSYQPRCAFQVGSVRWCSVSSVQKSHLLCFTAFSP